MINIDNGTVNFIPNENLRVLYKQFGNLPAQSFECRLHDIRCIDETELFEIIGKKCTIDVVGINQHDQVNYKFINM